MEFLPGYAAALARGWSPDNLRPAETAREQMAAIATNPAEFVAQMDDPGANAGPVTLPDGSIVPRLPGFRRWILTDDFCGSIGFRWQPGTSDLPAHVLGHIGYAVVPWRRRWGHATQALGLLLEEVRDTGLSFVELTTDPDNRASQAVILANGGRLVERFETPACHGGMEALRFRITL